MWAPDAAYYPSHPKGKGPFFFMFPHSVGNMEPGETAWNENWRIGLAHSNKAHAGFKNNEITILRDRHGRIIEGGGWLIDPCLFQEDGQWYLVTGGSGECRIAKLSDDLTSLAEDFRVYTREELPYYHEGPWMFDRYNDKGVKIYYLMYPGALGEGGDDMLYATSELGPYGPWTYQGSILKPTGTGDTSHGSIVQFREKWYLFYHNAALSGMGNLRSVCCEEIEFSKEGLILPVEQTLAGPRQNGPDLDIEALDAQFGAGSYTIE
jgi:hypothetical protein